MSAIIYFGVVMIDMFCLSCVQAIDARAETPVTPARPMGAIEIVEGDLTFLPALMKEHDADMLVEFVVRNRSAQSISYFPASPEGLEFLDAELIQEDGTSVPYCGYHSEWMLDPKFVQTLPPGGTIQGKFFPGHFGFNEEAGNYANGRYELRTARETLGRAGSTSIKIDSPVMLIDVVDEAPTRNTGGMGLLLIALTTMAIAEGMALIYGFQFLRTCRMRERARHE